MPVSGELRLTTLRVVYRHEGQNYSFGVTPQDVKPLQDGDGDPAPAKDCTKFLIRSLKPAEEGSEAASEGEVVEVADAEAANTPLVGLDPERCIGDVVTAEGLEDAVEAIMHGYEGV